MTTRPISPQTATYIVLERLDSTPVTVNGSVRLKVVSKGTGNSSFAIADNQMVLTKSDGAKCADLD